MKDLSFLLHAILLLLCINSLGCQCADNTPLSGSEPDRLTLLSVKEHLKDPFGSLSSWNESLDFCGWRGVLCSKRHPNRVSLLNLDSMKLQGILSPYIGNLTFLQILNIANNSFSGTLPQEIGRLFRLQRLVLRNNLFTSPIPPNISLCSNLRRVDLSGNRFSGDIPMELSYLLKLDGLSIYMNSFTGSIPPSFGNLTGLKQLILAQNNLEGCIPIDLCRLQHLFFFQVGTNNLTGNFPNCLYNLSSLVTLGVVQNQLEGSLPPDIGLTLPNLQGIYIGYNHFTGSIPVSFPNASNLEVIGLDANSFTGAIPRDLGRLQLLSGLFLSQNQLGSNQEDDLHFLPSLTNCSNLQQLEITANHLGGMLPDSIANLSTKMTFLNVGLNHLYGHIPAGIENLINLRNLVFRSNNLTGNIPTGIGKLTKLERLYMDDNGLSGPIPASLSNLTELTTLDLGDNMLQGSIPPSLANCRSLSFLNLSFNNLNGTIPKQVIGLSSLKLGLLLSHNALIGPLPSQVGNLSDLTMLDVYKNRLSGRIPDSLGNCLALVSLNLSDNLFEGNIPESLSALKGIRYLDLSGNKLSGQIPPYLGNFTLAYLNLSFNKFNGPVPNHGIFANVSLVTDLIAGNSDLCGGISELKLPVCTLQMAKKKRGFLTLIITISVILVTLCLLLLSCLYILCYKKKKLKKQSSSTSLFCQHYMRISYAELLRATDSFSPDNLIGIGGYGSVYKGSLEQIGTFVAVKVLNLQQRGASKSFLSECNALRNLRHRNLLKIITSCSSVDFQGNDFKALVFEYMPKGSLNEWLHPKVDNQCEMMNLSFLQRLNIAIEIASALDYLHHQCQPAVVHCDLKPSNVLLDDDMTAHLADFGLSKIFSTTLSTQSQTSSLLIKGSIGYVAPGNNLIHLLRSSNFYGLKSFFQCNLMKHANNIQNTDGTSGDVSMQGDVYSYGILLLEMFTGKRPTDEMFVDGLTLHSHVQIALPEEVMKIVDPMLLVEKSDVNLDIEKCDDGQNQMHEVLVSVMKIGVACSAESPIERTSMTEVVRELFRARDHLE